MIDLNKNMYDEQNFKITKENLKKFNFSDEDIDNIFNILSGILYLGNIKFKCSENERAEILNDSKEDLRRASNFLGLGEKKLEEILTIKKTYMGKELQTKNIKIDEIYIYRDGIAQELYSKLFEYIFEIIKSEIEMIKRL